MSVDSQEELFIQKLQMVLHAEQIGFEAQREMLQQASAPELQQALDQHLTETEKHIRNVEDVLSQLGAEPEPDSSGAMDALVEEGRANINSAGNDQVRDVAINDAILKNENYEVAGYTSLIAAANQMGYDQPGQLLSANLAEDQSAASLAENNAPALLG